MSPRASFALSMGAASRATPVSSGITFVTANSKDAATTTSPSVTMPAGIQAGDLLIAIFTFDNAPTVTAPAGWTRMNNMPVSSVTGCLPDAYYRIATGSEASSYTWTLSTTQKYGAGVAVFRGVNQSTPFDTTVSKDNSSGSVASISVSGITPTVVNTVLVAGVGLNSSTGTITLPASLAQALLATGGEAQVTQLSYVLRPTTTATGNLTFSVSPNREMGAWIVALRPA